jgi:hypothetical protein
VPADPPTEYTEAVIAADKHKAANIEDRGVVVMPGSGRTVPSAHCARGFTSQKKLGEEL